jgi:polysaccharide pyruvyl transferase WcaK-like protein
VNFYLAGQTNFGNRGCEALVRGTTTMVRRAMPHAQLLCPLDDVARDGRQWPEAVDSGVRFVPSPKFSGGMRWWARANRLLPLERIGPPPFGTDTPTSALLHDSAALIMTGGDIMTLDYGVMSLYQWTRMIENAMAQGVPAVLWAASVGPFSAKLGVERVMAVHLRRYAAITVRETVSLDYLRSIGVDHAELVADPAFHLGPESFDTAGLVRPGRRLLGVNVSPLIRKFRQDAASAAAMDQEVIAFLHQVLQETNLDIVLIPHVGPLDGGSNNSDWHYMEPMLAGFGGLDDRIRLAPARLNAGQLKHLIGACTYFMGARTHATIAALSQGVPTISIAYSTKAKGINKDLFGDLRYVLNTPEVNQTSLSAGLALLVRDEANVRALLADRVPEWRERALGSVTALARVARRPASTLAAA